MSAAGADEHALSSISRRRDQTGAAGRLLAGLLLLDALGGRAVKYPEDVEDVAQIPDGGLWEPAVSRSHGRGWDQGRSGSEDSAIAAAPRHLITSFRADPDSFAKQDVAIMRVRPTRGALRTLL